MQLKLLGHYTNKMAVCVNRIENGHLQRLHVTKFNKKKKRPRMSDSNTRSFLMDFLQFTITIFYCKRCWSKKILSRVKL